MWVFDPRALAAAGLSGGAGIRYWIRKTSRWGNCGARARAVLGRSAVFRLVARRPDSRAAGRD